MNKPSFTAAAKRDLAKIRDYSTQNYGPKLAREFMGGFERTFKMLGEQPFAGQPREELGLEDRSFSYKPYRILYRVKGRQVLVTRIIHQARDIRPAFFKQQ